MPPCGIPQNSVVALRGDSLPLTHWSESGSTEGRGGRRWLVFASGLEDPRISAGQVTAVTVRVGASR